MKDTLSGSPRIPPDLGIVVQDHVQRGIMDLEFSVAFDETQFAESVHEKAHTRSRRANHLRQRFLTERSHDRLWLAFPKFGASLVAGSDQLEQHAGFGLILADIGNVVEDQQVILVELGEHAFERELAARDLQALDEIAGAHEQHAPSILDESESGGCRKMALAGAGRAEQQEIGALFEPAIACDERHHLRLADHGHDLEVEAGERFTHGQSCFNATVSRETGQRGRLGCPAVTQGRALAQFWPSFRCALCRALCAFFGPLGKVLVVFCDPEHRFLGRYVAH
jgi:hypothetical protein